MEPIKTPTNEALNLQIEALKGRICMFEDDIEAYARFAREDNERNLKLILDLLKRTRWLAICVFLVSLSIFVHCIFSR